MTRSILLLVSLCAAGPSAAAGQAIRLEYRAEPGEQVARLFQAHVRVTASDPDGTIRTREVAKLGSMREQVLSASGGRYALHLRYDSLVVRQREGSGRWQESGVALSDSLWTQLVVDTRLRVQRRVGRGEESEAQLLQHLTTGFPELVLPEEPVRRGSSWDLQFEWSAAAATAGAAPGAAVLPVQASVVVDSLVPRTEDTLAYVTVRGTITRSRVRTADGGTVSYYGETGGTLVWSTRWGTFVSAATRTSVAALVEAGERRSQITIDTTIRQAVVP